MMAKILCRLVVNDEALNYKNFSSVDQVVDFRMRSISYTKTQPELSLL